MNTYTQCSLKSGHRFYKAWIPTKFAIKNKLIQFKREDGTWSNNWEVLSTGTTLPEEAVMILGKESKCFKDRIR